MVFYGKYFHKLDSKNRMRLPSEYRSQMRNGWFMTKKSGYLSIYPKEMLDKLSEKFEDELIYSPEMELKMESFFGSMFQAEEDEQGRFVLPKEYRNELHIDKDIVLVGVNNHINLWAKEVFEERQKSESGSDAMAGVLELLKKVEEKRQTSKKD